MLDALFYNSMFSALRLEYSLPQHIGKGCVHIVGVIVEIWQGLPQHPTRIPPHTHRLIFCSSFTCFYFSNVVPFPQKCAALIRVSCILPSEHRAYGWVFQAVCRWGENWPFVGHIQPILPLPVQSHYKQQLWLIWQPVGHVNPVQVLALCLCKSAQRVF